jgi:hypothetical protein
MADARITVCMVLDDSSRRILAGGEFDAKTTENRLHLLKEAMVSIKNRARVHFIPELKIGVFVTLRAPEAIKMFQVRRATRGDVGTTIHVQNSVN